MDSSKRVNRTAAAALTEIRVVQIYRAYRRVHKVRTTNMNEVRLMELRAGTFSLRQIDRTSFSD